MMLMSSVQLRPISVTQREAGILRRISGKSDASDAAAKVLTLAIRREQALATWEPPPAIARAVKNELERIDARDALKTTRGGRGRTDSAPAKRRRA